MNARAAIYRALGIGTIMIVSYTAGRQHQSDVVALCYATATNVRRMMEGYESANLIIWNALGLMAPPLAPAFVVGPITSPP